MHHSQDKYRIASVFTAIGMGLLAMLLGFSIIGSLFNIKALSTGFGDFFVSSYGILAIIIPLYLAFAAFILANPRWRPDHIFILSVSIFPFLTLCIGFVFIRDFEIRSQQFAFLDFAGKTGFSFVIVLITTAEALLLHVIKNLLFKNETEKQTSSGQHRYYLPPPSRYEADAVPAETAEPATTMPETVMALPEPEADPYETAALPEENHEQPDLSGANQFEVYPLDENQDETELLDSDGSAELESADEDEPLTENCPDGRLAGQFRGDDVEKALEEAEAAASEYSKQARKKAAAAHRNVAKSIRSYKIPVDFLQEYPEGEYWIIDEATRDAAMILKQTLQEFKIQAEVTGIRKGPVITMFEILPAPGVKLSRIVNLQDNIALRLAAASVRIVAPIPGKHAVGIEIPNARRNIVSFREIIEGELQQDERKMEIPLVMGKDITGEAQTIDLAQMPHMLIAGATGAGKSVCVNAMILSILYQRHWAECRLILIDPKIVELKLYNDIPHLLTPVITEPKKAFQALQYCIYEMERRYSCLDKMGVRNIKSYNTRIREENAAQEHMPYIIVVIDEYADLMSSTGKELEGTVARLAAKSRAVGIHLVLATQRPSIDVITGLIKANIPSRIAFMVASKMDSRIIIDMVGAEKLLGRGDMLYAGAVDPFPVRMQGAFVSEEDVEAVVDYIKTLGKPDYIDDEIFFEEDNDEMEPSLFSDGNDPLYDQALEIVVQQGKASASYIQRRLKIGYNRAARLVEEMEQNGVVGPAQGSKPREILRAY